MGKRKLKKEELDKVVTLGLLLEFTDTFLIPRMAEMIDERLSASFGEFEYKIKDYMDKKFATFESDLTNRYDRRYVLKK